MITPSLILNLVNMHEIEDRCDILNHGENGT